MLEEVILFIAGCVSHVSRYAETTATARYKYRNDFLFQHLVFLEGEKCKV
uniref:Uncharacterized protein n=1 Tax=Anguilla anguilla TaxID=7936 RepID=A0A0E9WZ97_ANGAN